MNKMLLTLAAVMTICLTACAQTKKEAKTEPAKTLIAYFSVTGNTARAAQTLAEVTGGKLFAITPQEVYTSADLDWHDKQSRSTVEMNNPQARPALKETVADLASYDVVFIGYPIWWNQAPRLINTFIEGHDLKGKKLIPFATSGGSGIDNSVKELKKAYPDLNWQNGKLLNRADKNTVQAWIGGLK